MLLWNCWHARFFAAVLAAAWISGGCSSQENAPAVPLKDTPVSIGVFEGTVREFAELVSKQLGDKAVIITCAKPESRVSQDFGQGPLGEVIIRPLKAHGLHCCIQGRTVFITEGSPVPLCAVPSLTGHVSLSPNLRRWLNAPLKISVRCQSTSELWLFLITLADTTVYGEKWEDYPSETVPLDAILVLGSPGHPDAQVSLTSVQGTVADALWRIAQASGQDLCVVAPNVLGLRLPLPGEKEPDDKRKQPD